jgi:hypothetical protein
MSPRPSDLFSPWTISIAGSCWACSVGALAGVWVLQDDGAGLQQGLEVGDDLRPAAGHRRDEFRRVALDGVGDGELDRRATGFQFDRAQRLAFGFELGLVLMLPADLRDEPTFACRASVPLAMAPLKRTHHRLPPEALGRRPRVLRLLKIG